MSIQFKVAVVYFPCSCLRVLVANPRSDTKCRRWDMIEHTIYNKCQEAEIRPGRRELRGPVHIIRLLAVYGPASQLLRTECVRKYLIWMGVSSCRM